MAFAQVSILGGLPIIAEVWFDEDAAGVDGLYWPSRKKQHGSPLSTSIMARVMRDPYWQSDVIDQAVEYLTQLERND